MKVIQNSINMTGNILNLFYSTCTNEMFINSRPTNILEDFIFAFFIEFNRLFIADSLVVNKLQKHIIEKTKQFINSKMNVCNVIVTQIRDMFLEVFETNTMFSVFYKLRLIDKKNSENYSFSKSISLIHLAT